MLYREITAACSQIHTKQIHAVSGIRTRNPSQRAAADLRLSAATAIGHWTCTNNIKTGLQFTSTPPYTVPAMPQCHLSYHNGKAADWAVRWAGVCVCVCFCVVGLCLHVPCFRNAIWVSFSTLVLGIISAWDLQKKFAWPWPSRNLLLRHTMWVSYQTCGKKADCIRQRVVTTRWTQCHNRPAANRPASWKGNLRFVQPKDVL